MINDKTLERFMSKVNKTDTCWLWIASKTKDGYGRFRVGEKIKGSHRVSYSHFVGEIPEGLQIDHLCRVRNCVNPDHLEPVTHIENQKRGVSGIHERSKTSCPKGHPYSGVRKDSKRICHKCKVESQNKYIKNKKIRESL